ncbi:MAG: molybdenum cofactor guanylyltransferase [Candidatus Bathyarchaeota archaeon]|nr:molybdenum cofactor guanylyltransferase [Candidatus Termiticorpusculum sp.]
MVRRTALVLAGGMACRFQSARQGWQDKALALFEDKPFLIHIIENIAGLVDEVIVCVNDEERIERYNRVLERYKLSAKFVVDEKAVVGGPICAILTGLKAAMADNCLIVPCDMPFVRANVANYLFDLAKDFDVVMPMWPNGRLETLFMVLERSIGVEIVETLCQLGRSHVDDIPRAASKVLLPSPVKVIRTLDPQLESFININCPKDLEALQTRSTDGSIREDIQFLRGKILISKLQRIREAAIMCQENNFLSAQEIFESCKRHFETCNNFFWTAITAESKGETLLRQLQLQKNINLQASLSQEAFFDAADNYSKEAKSYEEKSCTLLLERAFADKNRCETLHIKNKQ